MLCHLIIFLALSPARAESFSSWSAKAEKAQKKGESDIALEAWSSALRLWKSADGKGRKAKALATRAAIYEKAGEDEAALADLSEALKLDGKRAPYFHRRGQVYLKLGKLAEAISDFYGATKLDINFAAAYADRGEAYAQQGDLKFAKEDFHTACRLGAKAACLWPKRPAPPSKAGESGPTAAYRKVRVGPPDPIAEPESVAVNPIDFQACLAAIDACGEEGNSIGICVRKAKICQKDSPRGCCPRTCVRDFNRGAAANQSDAELFRRHFSVKSDCLRGVATR